MEFEVDDLVFVKTSPLKHVMRFGNVGKLVPRFVGHFKVLEQIRSSTYRVDLLEMMVGVHNVFHLSHL